MNERPLILVIDDDPDILTMIKVMLEFNDYSVITAENEQQCLDILENNPVNVLIMDMLLSGKDGTDICRHLKKDPKYSTIPILMFSAHPNAREACLSAGANEFMAKPFEMQEMLKKVEGLAKEVNKMKNT